MTLIQLVDFGGELELNGEPLIYRYRYPESEWPEYDNCKWPFQVDEDRRRLRLTLWDCIETGELPSKTRAVLLPDGSEFRLDCEEDA